MHIKLEKIYERYNRMEFVHPDPLEFLYNYDSLQDREIVGLIASALAYGRVNQILKSVSKILAIMDNSPIDFLMNNTDDIIYKSFKGFKHRFTDHNDIADLLLSIKGILREYGSIRNCFESCHKNSDDNILPALVSFTKVLNHKRALALIPNPENQSACKRLNLYLRWMVRKDDVDPGGWNNIPRSKLIVPLDVHMHRIAIKLGLSNRKQANMLTALEITDAFKKYSPNDPVKYDFALTRFGIRSDLNETTFFT